MKKNTGITLIALVITIIVLLILAGVTIATLTGDNGLLQKATTAKQENEDSKELELIKLAVSAAQVAGEGKITTGNLNTELQANLNDTNTTATEIKGGWSYKSYKIETNGNVYKLLPEEYQQVEYIESTGTQWIDTKIQEEYIDYKFEFDAMFLFQYSDHAKSFLGNSSESFYIGGTGIGYYTICYNGEKYNNNKIDLNTKTHNVLKTAPGIQEWVSDNIIKVSANNSEILNTTKPLSIFRGRLNRTDYGNPTKIRLYNMKIYIYSKNEILADFIPCKSVTTVVNAEGVTVPANTKGLYDLVEGKFYTNANTAADAVDFIAGPEV